MDWLDPYSKSLIYDWLTVPVLAGIIKLSRAPEEKASGLFAILFCALLLLRRAVFYV